MTDSTQPVRTSGPQPPSPSTDASTARYVLSAEEFAFADLFERVPDTHVECESAVANPDDHALVVIRTDGRKRAVDAALRSDPSVAAADCFSERTDGWTYRVTWEGRPRQLIQRLVAADVTLLSVQGRGGEWKMRLLAPEREGIARAHDIMNDLGCEADCRSITTVDGRSTSRSDLTNGQREALVEAFKKGYYNIPRTVPAEEVADALDISHQALSERFRRAHKQLIETKFVTSGKGQF